MVGRLALGVGEVQHEVVVGPHRVAQRQVGHAGAQCVLVGGVTLEDLRPGRLPGGGDLRERSGRQWSGRETAARV